MLKKFYQSIKAVITYCNGTREYQNYLQHQKYHHPQNRPLSKGEFFAKKQQDKWGKINRCC